MHTLILALTLSVVSPTRTAHRPTCPAGIEFVRAHSAGYPDDWSIVVVCGRAEWERYMEIWQVRSNKGAFTILNARRTFIFYDEKLPGIRRMDLTIELLAHELRHVRCQCDLGEGEGHR